MKAEPAHLKGISLLSTEILAKGAGALFVDNLTGMEKSHITPRGKKRAVMN